MTETRQIAKNPRIVLIGSVNSSALLLKKLIEHEMNLVLVLGLHPKFADNVSGYQDLKSIADKVGIPFSYFEKINDNSVIQLIKKVDPDLLLVVGLSQLIGKTLIDLPKNGAIGYHPTLLPKGRGRAAIAWIVLGKVAGAANLFLIDEGVDSGPILVQEPIQVSDQDYAQDVIDKLLRALSICCDRVFPLIKLGQMPCTRQNEQEASYLGVRRPNDGLIEWNQSAKSIARLVRAVSHPLPGAFSIYQRQKLYVWKADADMDLNYMGVPGRILIVEPDRFYVATAEGVLRITSYTCGVPFKPKVGIKLGINLSEILLDE